MSRKLKKIFSLLAKKKIPLLFLIFLGVFLPTQTGAVLGWIADLGQFAVSEFVLTFIALGIAVGKFFLGLAAILLNWVLSPEGFTSWSYTDPENNPIINIGLGITQGLVNMMLVLVLVYIALATILRLGGYETKKLLVTFIIVALLVNFAPVFVGVLTDAANILMNAFVGPLLTDTSLVGESSNPNAFSSIISAKADQIFGKIKGADSIEEILSGGLAAIAMIVFLFMLTFVLGIFAAAFMLRHLVIWILVILSPIAFASYILPRTKAMIWDRWWEQLIQWLFIGITLAFFLWLGMQFVALTPDSINKPPATGQGGDFDAILPYIASLLFLGLGFVIGISTSAMGASAVINITKRGMRGGARLAGRGAWKGARLAARGAIIKPVKLAIGRPPGSADIQSMGRWTARATTRGIEKVGLGRYVPEALREAGETRIGIDAAQQKMKKISPTSLAHGLARGAFRGEEGVAAMSTILEKGDSQDIMDAFRKKYGAKTDADLLNNVKARKHLRSILHIAKNAGLQENILKQDPRFARLVAGQKWAGKYKNMNEKEAVRDLIHDIKPNNIDNWEPQTLQDRFVPEPIMAQWEQRRFQKLESIKGGQKTAQAGFDREFSEWVDTTIGQSKKSEDQGLYRKITKGTLEEKESASKKVWEGKYKEFLKSQYGRAGYHTALENERFRQAGWEAAQYKLPEERKTEEEEKIEGEELKEQKRKEGIEVAWHGGPSGALVARALGLSQGRPVGQPLKTMAQAKKDKKEVLSTLQKEKKEISPEKDKELPIGGSTRSLRQMAKQRKSKKK